jgi:hypothetical protein
MRNATAQEFPLRLKNRSVAEVIALGDSTVEGGFNEDAFLSEWHIGDGSDRQRALNAGMGGAGLTQWYVVWKLVSEGRSDIKHLIVGVFDHRLTSPARLRWSGWFGVDALAFYADPAWSERYGCSGFVDRLCCRVTRRFALFTERGGMWAKVELARRFLGTLGMDAEARNRFGRLRDMDRVLEQDYKAFSARTRGVLRNRSPLVPQIADMLVEARGRGIATTVVMMPLPAGRQGWYATVDWKDYLRYVQGLVEPLGARLIVATSWIPESDGFVDALHLSKSGAEAFSRRLAREMMLR